jgi:L-ascorbate metabolism protein UlaG (beta-lactamase superfamily)
MIEIVKIVLRYKLYRQNFFTCRILQHFQIRMTHHCITEPPPAAGLCQHSSTRHLNWNCCKMIKNESEMEVNVKILFVRHATMVVTANGKRILIDPMFSDAFRLPSIPNSVSKSKNPMIRLETPIEELTNVDSAIITHLHLDHFDVSAREQLPKTIKIFCQPDDADIIKGFGFQNVTPVNESISWEGLTIYRVDAKHGEGEVLEKMGKASGFVLEDTAHYKLYIAGDSIWCEEVKKTIKRFNPNTIVLNAGAATFPIGRPVTMNETDIEAVIDAAPGSKIVAVHMESWNHCMLSRSDLKKFLSAKGLEDKVIMPAENTVINL